MASLDEEINDPDTDEISTFDAPRGRTRGGELAENEELDSEGQPDLMGDLPQKEITGDAQEGEIPPGEYWRDPDHRDTLDERLREEVPDVIRPDVEEVRVLDDEFEDGGAELRSELGDEGGYPSAEEAGMHIVNDAPGAVNEKIDSYTGDPVEDLDFREER